MKQSPRNTVLALRADKRTSLQVRLSEVAKFKCHTLLNLVYAVIRAYKNYCILPPHIWELGGEGDVPSQKSRFDFDLNSTSSPIPNRERERHPCETNFNIPFLPGLVQLSRLTLSNGFSLESE